MSSGAVRLLVAVLTLTGLTLVAYKHWVLGYPLLPGAAVSSWSVEARVRLQADGGPVTVRLRIPSEPYGYGILEEGFVSDQFGLTTFGRGGSRVAEWTVRQASGPQTLYYRAVVYRRPRMADAQAVETVKVPELEEPYRTAAERIVDSVRAQSAGARSLASLLVQRLVEPNPGAPERMMLERGPGAPDPVRTAVLLLAYAGVPARRVAGLELDERRTGTRLLPWLQVYDNGRWVGIDPESGEARWPEDMLLWSRQGGELLEIEGGTGGELEVSVARNLRDALALAERRSELVDSPLGGVSLSGLPLGTQNVYRALLLVPVGALVVIVFRNLVGVQTIGTFMPILIALAFRETGLLVGLVLLVVIVGTGLAIRFYLDRLRMLLVPRLSAVLTIVVALMLVASLLADHWQLDRGLSVALFPIVIMAMTIEHLSVAWEERGAEVAMQQAAGSLAVAVIGYLLMINDVVVHLMFTFPELLLLVLAASIVLGRYTGYRLTELWRFRSIGA